MRAVTVIAAAIRAYRWQWAVMRPLPWLHAGATLAAVVTGAAIAEHSDLVRNSEEPAIEFDFDKPIDADHHITDHLFFGAEVSIETESAFNFDLDDGEGGSTHDMLPKLTLALAYEPSNTFRFFTEVELEKKLIVKDGRYSDEDLAIRLEEAYVTLRDVDRDITLMLGRILRSDEREWLLDEDLDGGQLILRSDALALELSYGREGHFRRDLLKAETEDRPDYYMARLFVANGDDSHLSGFAIYQDGHEGSTDEDLFFAGIQSEWELDNNLDIWADAALVYGDVNGRTVRGLGFDTGVTKTFKDVPLRPSVTAAVAFGSGDDGSGTDTAFRQTGLQGNSDKFAGVNGFQYYGEVLDPELSNLGILTLGAGIRPTRRSSVDLVYHRYYQHRRSDEFRDVAIDADPNGESRHLGDGLDLVIGIDEIEDINLELVGGVFFPGRAFDNRDPAFFAGMTLEIEF